MKTIPCLATLTIGLVAITGSAPAEEIAPRLLSYQGRVRADGEDFTGAGQFKFAIVDGGTELSGRATAKAQVGIGGTVVGISMIDGGAGYQTAPPVSISSGPFGGSGATAVATVSGGEVVKITVTAGGSGYAPIQTPTVTIGAPPSLVSYVTHWSNDATSVDGNEPTSAVSVAVQDGLFEVMLGDTRMANMDALPDGVFRNPNLHLRIWFSDETGPFAHLQPDQPFSSAPFALLAAGVEDGAIGSAALAPSSVTGDKIAGGSVDASQIADGSIGAEELAPGAAFANLGASGQGFVPQSGVIMSPDASSADLTNAGYARIGSIDLDLSGWTQTSTVGAPTPVTKPTAVWTGDRMITWGGWSSIGGYFNSGGIYEPVLDSWVPISLFAAPEGRYQHTAVWTGERMIIWGGSLDGGTPAITGTGGSYDPDTDLWAATSTVNAPLGRSNHTAVWTGSRMIVWGGSGEAGTSTLGGSGGIYDPINNLWSAISTAVPPGFEPRLKHHAAWTGEEMIIWGGQTGALDFVSDGARYDLATDSWTAMSSVGAPNVRHSSAVWGGGKFIVWGGQNISTGIEVATGAAYDPETDTWASLPTTGAPIGRYLHKAVWADDRMIVWGGNLSLDVYTSSGGVYDPVANTWGTTGTQGAPLGRIYHALLWTGSRALVWGGNYHSTRFNNGGLYDPDLSQMYLWQKQ